MTCPRISSTLQSTTERYNSGKTLSPQSLKANSAVVDCCRSCQYCKLWYHPGDSTVLVWALGLLDAHAMVYFCRSCVTIVNWEIECPRKNKWIQIRLRIEHNFVADNFHHQTVWLKSRIQNQRRTGPITMTSRSLPLTIRLARSFHGEEHGGHQNVFSARTVASCRPIRVH